MAGWRQNCRPSKRIRLDSVDKTCVRLSNSPDEILYENEGHSGYSHGFNTPTELQSTLTPSEAGGLTPLTWHHGTHQHLTIKTHVTQFVTNAQSTAEETRDTVTTGNLPVFDGTVGESRPSGHHGLPDTGVGPRSHRPNSTGVRADQVCFGMLDNIPVQMLQSNGLDLTAASISVFFTTGSKTLQLQTAAGSTLGSLDPRYSKLLQVLQKEQEIELQAYLIPTLSRNPNYGRSQQLDTQAARQRDKSVTLSVIFYGPMDVFESIGEFLSQCSEYLQSPLRCDRNVPYRNPQSLSGRDEEAPLTFQLESDLSSSQIETIAQGSDPSAALETGCTFPETETPPAIQTRLYSHQKQALSFMLKREQGWDLYSDRDDVWKAAPSEPHGVTRYYNTVTGDVSVYRPGAFRGGILADSMGLGKSLTVISLLATDWSEHAQRSIGVPPTLLVVPLSLLRTWEEELRRHLHPQTLRCLRYHGPKRTDNIATMLSHDIVLTTYDLVASQWRTLEKGPKLLFSTTWRRIVLDEAHEIRTGTIEKAKAVCALRGDLRWAISGTPIQNRWEDLAGLLGFLKVYPDGDIKPLKAMLRSNATNLQVRRMLALICLRRSKKTIQLPRRIDKIHTVEFDAEEAAQYNIMNISISGSLQQESLHECVGTYSNILSKINSLRQMCNLGTYYQRELHAPVGSGTRDAGVQGLFDGMLSAGLAMCSICNRDLSTGDEGNEWPLADTDASEACQPCLTTCGELICASCFAPPKIATRRKDRRCQHQPLCEFFAVTLFSSYTAPKFHAASRLPVKMRALQKDLVALPETDKSIIFSFWTTTLNLVGSALNELRLPYTRVDGAMPVKQRQQALKSFIEDSHVRVLLISLRCGSNGLNLTAANHVFLMEPQWNPMVEDQALDRVYRIGQTKEVTTVRYIVQGTLETSIRHQQSKKRNLAEQAFALNQRHNSWIERIRAMLSNAPT